MSIHSWIFRPVLMVVSDVNWIIFLSMHNKMYISHIDIYIASCYPCRRRSIAMEYVYRDLTGKIAQNAYYTKAGLTETVICVLKYSCNVLIKEIL